MRDGQTFGNPVDTGEVYDLVVVGAGLSGLSAAYYYRKQLPSAKVLILDGSFQSSIGMLHGLGTPFQLLPQCADIAAAKVLRLDAACQLVLDLPPEGAALFWGILTLKDVVLTCAPAGLWVGRQ